jgi:hypothetical protein
MTLYRVTYSFPQMDGDRRLRELILYVSAKCAPDPGFGSTKLNKILHRADFQAFAKRGTPLTGVEYQALDNGPAPKRLLPVKNDMLELREIDEVPRQIGEFVQYRVVPRRSADLSIFSADDLRFADAAIDELWGKTGGLVSRESHGLAWRIARKGDGLIPYEAAFLDDNEAADPRDVTRARELAHEFGWRWD